MQYSLNRGKEIMTPGKLDSSNHPLPSPGAKTVGSFLGLLLVGWLITLPLQGQQEKKQEGKTPRDSRGAVSLFNGRDLKGLLVLKKSYYEDHGKVRIDNRALVIGKGMPGSGITVDPKIVKDLPRMNYEVFLSAKRVEGNDFFCGLTFPVEKAYCTMILGGWGGGSIGLSNVDSLSAIENETSGFHEFENNQWYEIHLVVSEKTIRATLNREGWKEKKELFSVETQEHKYDIWWEQEPARPLGITTWNTTAAFRKIEIRRLPEKKRK
ncbi:MAG: family 16 glycoside hydrolase [Planctomycetota bacterium]|nr:family 16 glycoside hydrolase [Planctomycetota bacterium]